MQFLQMPQTRSSSLPQCVIAPAAGPVAFAPTPTISKTSAILGGSPSRLDEMVRQQSGSQSAGLVQTKAIEPQFVAAPCSNAAQLVQTSINIAKPATKSAVYGVNDYLNSKRLSVSHTNFDPSWNRVRSARISGTSRIKEVLGAAGGDRAALLASVNAWTNSNIRYVRDSSLYGKSDYWANASTTLRKRAGDCEDIAILKMQLLAAAGVSFDDMHLTIAQDLARREAHAMLVVRLNGRFVVLDDATNQLLDANAPLDYMPIMSFSDNRKWLHGF